jgi:hypothetical protein
MAETIDFINQVAAGDFAKAGPTFSELVQTIQNDALEAEKVAIADTIFNDAEPEDDSIDPEEAYEGDDDTTDDEVEVEDYEGTPV